MNKADFKKWIRANEGYNPKPYIDTVGKLTIGYGRNIQDNGISLDEAELMLDNDIKRSETELLQFSWYITAPGNVKDALLNMCFNMGITKLLGFRKMIQSLINKDYTNAAIEALDSLWAKQVGQRAKDVALMMRQG